LRFFLSRRKKLSFTLSLHNKQIKKVRSKKDGKLKKYVHLSMEEAIKLKEQLETLVPSEWEVKNDNDE